MYSYIDGLVQMTSFLHQSNDIKWLVPLVENSRQRSGDAGIDISFVVNPNNPPKSSRFVGSLSLYDVYIIAKMNWNEIEIKHDPEVFYGIYQ